MSWLTEVLVAAELIERVLRERPGLRLTVLVGDYESMAPKIMSGRVEFFVGPPAMGGAGGVTSQPLAEFPAGVVARASHPLARRADVSVADLVAAQWILPVAGTVPRSTYDAAFVRRGVAPPEPLFEVQPLSPVIRKLLLDVDLLTILPLVVVESEIANGTIKVLPFDDGLTFSIHLTQRQVRDPSAARDYVIRELEALFRARAARASLPPDARRRGNAPRR
jgi:LysR family transcriptional regulator of gallate degradation